MYVKDVSVSWFLAQAENKVFPILCLIKASALKRHPIISQVSLAILSDKPIFTHVILNWDYTLSLNYLGTTLQQRRVVMWSSLVHIPTVNVSQSMSRKLSRLGFPDSFWSVVLPSSDP